MKLETIEHLSKKGVITLIECDEKEKVNNKNVVKNRVEGKWYKVEESNEDVRLELLARNFKCISTIKNIMVGFTALFLVYALFFFMFFIYELSF